MGVLTWFPVHGTSLLGNHTHAAADNKGVAAWMLEEAMQGDSSATHDFVAGFSQANVGDTTPNVLGAYCDDGSGQQCSLEKSTCADGKSQSCHGRGPGFRELDRGVKSCFEIGRRQFVGAKKIHVSPVSSHAASPFLIPCTSRRAYHREKAHSRRKDSLDASGTPVVGSSVKAFHFFHDMRFWEFTLPNGSKAMTCPAALGYSFAAGTSDWPGAFDFTQGDSGKPNANPLWRLVSGMLRTPSKEQKRCQGAKPILLDVGEMDKPYAWTPNIVDIQTLRVGQLLIIVSPSEATTMSGRRWKAAVAKEAARFLDEDPIVVLGGPGNSYSHYCATPEEYEIQRYEGASTLFGPHQLDAFVNLTVGNMHYLDPKSTGSPDQGDLPPDNRNRALSFIPGVVLDSHPPRSDFGRTIRQPGPSHALGAIVNVTFQGASPRNNLRLEQTFAAVEQQGPDSSWRRVRDDRDWFLVYSWRRTNWRLGHSEVDIWWETAGNARAGTYRFKYYGDSKPLFGRIKPFEGTSSSFRLS